MKYDPSGTLITSFLELKLDQTTVFEWQKHNQDSKGVPHYKNFSTSCNLELKHSKHFPGPIVEGKLTLMWPTSVKTA